MPFAIASAGLLASAVSLILVALLSFLTCSWLLEVGDRANALQNELSRANGAPIEVEHADGGISLLPPAAAFCLTPLKEPLIERREKKLGEYRAAYRSWRQGSNRGARDSQLRKLRKLLVGVYQSHKHRELLPLQLVPPRLLAIEVMEDADEEAFRSGFVPLAETSRPLANTACSSANNSSQSLDRLVHDRSNQPR